MYINIHIWLGLRSSLTWHVKIHDFESIPKTKNKESSMFWDIIGVGICNISTNEAFYAEKSSILRISYTKSEIVSFILNWHIVLVLLTLIMDIFTSNIFIPPSFLPLYISFPPSPSKINGFIYDMMYVWFHGMMIKFLLKYKRS